MHCLKIACLNSGIWLTFGNNATGEIGQSLQLSEFDPAQMQTYIGLCISFSESELLVYRLWWLARCLRTPAEFRKE